MPIYEYRCENCDEISEFLVGVTQQKEEIKCKRCGGKELNKILSGSFVHVSKNQDCRSCLGKEDGCDMSACKMKNRS
jgi:putative FmdB family regulatory protein